MAYFVAGDHDAAAGEARYHGGTSGLAPWPVMWLAAAIAAGRPEEARLALEICVANFPGIDLGSVVPRYMFRFVRDEDHEQLMTMLRQGGLPA